MLDIDFFKQYNDTFGHLVGDRILVILCTAIRHHIKQTDAVGRWGGEEFAISLPGASSVDALGVAERIRQTMLSLRWKIGIRRQSLFQQSARGSLFTRRRADEIYRLVDLADHRLYIAKSRGRNQVEPSQVQEDVTE